MKDKITIGKRKVDRIFYINERKLRCEFEREYNKANNDYVAIMITYDDFAEDKDKWEIKEHHYNTNGDFTFLQAEDYLTDEERNEIKDNIVDYFNRNYDITQLLEMNVRSTPIQVEDIDSGD